MPDQDHGDIKATVEELRDEIIKVRKIIESSP